MGRTIKSILCVTALLAAIAIAHAEGGAPLVQLKGIDDAHPATLDVPPMPSDHCPDVDLSAQHNYDPFIQMRRRVAPLVVMNETARRATIKGGRGVDTIQISDGGWFDIEDVHLKSVEVYDIRNSASNGLRIFAAGLASMNGRHAMIIGDKDIDTVYLDPCLQWGAPIAVDDGPEPLTRYDAHDKDGNKASVSVTAGVKVVEPDSKPASK